MRRKTRDVSRRTLPASVIIAILVVAGACAVSDEGESPKPRGTTAPDSIRVLVGTYTGGESRGIYRLEIDAESGGLLTGPSLAGASENPSFLAFHPSGKWLYAVNEVANFRGGATGAVSAFAVDPVSGDLTLLGQQSSQGADPCHLIVDGAGRHLLVANYTSGSVALCPLAADGRIEPATSVRQYAGSGPNRTRQEGPHAHAVLMDGARRFVLCADLGTDRIHVERFDAGAGRLAPNEPDGVSLEPGSGPRHLAWHPNGRVLYAINELRSTVSAFLWDETRGVLTWFQTAAALPEGFSGTNTAAEIVVSPDGRFVYASNRGHDSLAVFAADATGGLAPAGWVESGGRTPRSFAIDRSGRWLIVANQDSDSVVVFSLDPETGFPRAVGTPIAVPEPVAVVFFPSQATRNEVEP
jgi:6-phosphogluconolactonase